MKRLNKYRQELCILSLVSTVIAFDKGLGWYCIIFASPTIFFILKAVLLEATFTLFGAVEVDGVSLEEVALVEQTTKQTDSIFSAIKGEFLKVGKLFLKTFLYTVLIFLTLYATTKNEPFPILIGSFMISALVNGFLN